MGGRWPRRDLTFPSPPHPGSLAALPVSDSGSHCGEVVSWPWAQGIWEVDRRFGGRVGAGVPHCSVLTICVFSAVSALTCQLLLPRSSCPTTWQYPFVGPAPGGRAGGQGGADAWQPQERPGQAGASALTALDTLPMASPSWRLAMVRPISSAPWWPSRTLTQPAWPSGPCSVRAALAAGGGRKGGAGRAERPASPPGAGVLVTTVVAGGIAILRPFTAASRPFLRDIVFYMAAVFLTFTALYCGRVTLAWALGESSHRAGRGHAGLRGGRHRGSGWDRTERPAGHRLLWCQGMGTPPKEAGVRKGTMVPVTRGAGGAGGGVQTTHDVKG